MNDYRFVVNGDAFRFFTTRRPKDRIFLEACFLSLEQEPFTTGEFQEETVEGRTIEILLRGSYEIAFWADHAVKELRIVRVEKVQLR